MHVILAEVEAEFERRVRVGWHNAQSERQPVVNVVDEKAVEAGIAKYQGLSKRLDELHQRINDINDIELDRRAWEIRVHERIESLETKLETNIASRVGVESFYKRVEALERMHEGQPEKTTQWERAIEARIGKLESGCVAGVDHSQLMNRVAALEVAYGKLGAIVRPAGEPEHPNLRERIEKLEKRCTHFDGQIGGVVRSSLSEQIAVERKELTDIALATAKRFEKIEKWTRQFSESGADIKPL